MVNTMRTPPDGLIDVRLSWREWVTVRRLRLGWTKADLAEHSGVSRTWLWRALECDPASERAVEISCDVYEKVEAALVAAESMKGEAVAA